MLCRCCNCINKLNKTSSTVSISGDTWKQQQHLCFPRIPQQRGKLKVHFKNFRSNELELHFFLHVSISRRVKCPGSFFYPQTSRGNIWLNLCNEGPVMQDVAQSYEFPRWGRSWRLSLLCFCGSIGAAEAIMVLSVPQLQLSTPGLMTASKSNEKKNMRKAQCTDPKKAVMTHLLKSQGSLE